LQVKYLFDQSWDSCQNQLVINQLLPCTNWGGNPGKLQRNHGFLEISWFKSSKKQKHLDKNSSIIALTVAREIIYLDKAKKNYSLRKHNLRQKTTGHE